MFYQHTKSTFYCYAFSFVTVTRSVGYGTSLREEGAWKCLVHPHRHYESQHLTVGVFDGRRAGGLPTRSQNKRCIQLVVRPHRRPRGEGGGDNSTNPLEINGVSSFNGARRERQRS